MILLPDRSILHISGVTFSRTFFWFAKTFSRVGQRLENQKLSLDIETGIKTLEYWGLILRLESRISNLKSWYWDWNKNKNRGDPCDQDFYESQCSSLLECTPLSTLHSPLHYTKLLSTLHYTLYSILLFAPNFTLQYNVHTLNYTKWTFYSPH